MAFDSRRFHLKQGLYSRVGTKQLDRSGKSPCFNRFLLNVVIRRYSELKFMSSFSALVFALGAFSCCASVCACLWVWLIVSQPVLLPLLRRHVTKRRFSIISSMKHFKCLLFASLCLFQ